MESAFAQDACKRAKARAHLSGGAMVGNVVDGCWMQAPRTVGAEAKGALQFPSEGQLLGIVVNREARGNSRKYAVLPSHKMVQEVRHCL